MMKDILILGIGNLILNDEGVGIHIAHILKSMEMPDGVEVLDGGNGHSLVPEAMLQYKRLIFIDATIDDNPVGTVRRVSSQISSDLQQLHYEGNDVVDSVIKAMIIQDDMPLIDVLAVSVQHNPTPGIQLSPEVRRVIPQVLQLIFEILDTSSHKRYYR